MGESRTAAVVSLLIGFLIITASVLAGASVQGWADPTTSNTYDDGVVTHSGSAAQIYRLNDPVGSPATAGFTPYQATAPALWRQGGSLGGDTGACGPNPAAYTDQGCVNAENGGSGGYGVLGSCVGSDLYNPSGLNPPETSTCNSSEELAFGGAGVWFKWQGANGGSPAHGDILSVSVGHWNGPITCQSGNSIGVNQDGSLSGSVFTGANGVSGTQVPWSTSAGTLTAGSWAYLAMTATASGLWTIYVNGQSVTTVSGGSSPHIGEWGLGQWFAGNPYNCNGGAWGDYSEAWFTRGSYSSSAIANDYSTMTNTPPAPTPTPPSQVGGGSASTAPQSNCQNTANPVNCATGEFWHRFTDFAIKGRGLGLSLARTYSSALASQDGPLGFGWTHSYNMSLTVNSDGSVTVHEEGGSAITFVVNAGAFIAPTWVFATLTKNGDGTYTLQRKDQTTFVFSASGQLSKELDRNGYATTLSYSGGLLSSVTDASGRQLQFSYSGSHLVKVSDPIGRSVAFQYDGNGNLSAATDVGGGLTTFTYDGSHHLLTMTDPNGGVLTNSYDSSGRVVSQTDPVNRTTTWSYGNAVTTITDPAGNQTQESFQNGELTSITKAYGTSLAATWSMTYDQKTFTVTSVTDPNQHTTTYSSDASGNLLSMTDPLSRTWTFTYDGLNDLTAATDPLGNTTRLAYDGNGNLLSVSEPISGSTQAVTSLTYDPANPGDVISVKDPNGNSYQFGHDGYGNVVKATDPLQNVSTFSYDAVSRLSNSVSPKGNVTGGNPAAYQTSYTYDAFGDVLTLTDPLGHTTRYQYDADRNLTAVTDANGHTTRYAYDADNEPLAGTRADGSQVQNGYNAAGLLASQTDALGHVTTYVYNALERLVSVTDPLNRVTSEGYDPAGNLTSLVDAMGRTTTYSYDGTNELTAVVYSDGKTPNVSYAYDADGRRTSMADGTGTTTYAYDNADRLTQSVNGAGARVGYGYDLNGNLTALTYPGGSQVTQSFNADSELASVSDWLGNTTTFGYDPNGNLTSEIYPNTVQATRAYNAADQLTQIAYSGPLGQISLTEGRDNLGQQTSETVAGAPPNGPISYGYDEVNRLTSANYGASIPQLSYQYDAADRLTQVTSVSSSSTIVSTLAYDPADELISLTKTLAGVQVQKLQYSYDADGNRTQRTDQTGATTTYTYDQANRLTNFNGIAQYSYNGDGLRMGKTVKSAAEAFTWNVASQLPLLIQDGATRYVTGPGGLPLEQIASDGTVRYYLQDALGSTRALTNAKGLLDTAYLYDPYGNLLYVSGSTTPNPFQFAGQYTDSESGLQYLQARYYDATTAQFITSDPRLLKIGHTYTYVSDTPLNGTDPTGRLSLRDIQSAWGVLSSNAGLISDFTGGLALITAVDVPVSVTLSAISTGFGVIDAINKCQGGQLFTFGCGFAVAGALLGAAGIAFKTLQLLIGLPAKLAALGAGALADAAIEAIGFKRLVRFVNTANYLAALSWPDWLAGAFTALDELLYGWKNRAAFLSNPPGASQSAALPIDSSPTKAGGC